MIKYQFFPRSVGITPEIEQIISCFSKAEDRIKSPQNNLSSDKVLGILKPYLEEFNLKVESGKSKVQKISVPVLFGLNNKIDKNFEADAVSHDGKIILEVEAGRAVLNYQFLKDIFEACMMYGVEYLVLAVRNDYLGNDDFQKVHTFLETLYISNRLNLPLKGILVVGY